MPIDKVEKSDQDDDTYLVAGLASTPDRDLQGEQIDPSGLDIGYLLNSGWIDFEHDQDQVIGVPTSNTHVDAKGLFLEAKLFKNMPQVQDIIKLYHNIKDNGINRSLGFSIEGNVIERDSDDDSIIRQVQITGVAVTKNPANTHATWELLTKSLFNNETPEASEDKKPMMAITYKVKDQANKALTAGHGITPATQTDGAAFRTENLSNQLVSLAENIKQAKDIGLSAVKSVADLLTEQQADDDVMVLFLQLFEGLSYTDSEAIVRAINTKGLTDDRLEHILDGADDITDDDD